MAIDFVSVNSASKFGRELVSLADMLRNAKARAEAVKERMDHMRADNGSNGAMITTHFGLTPETSAVGEAAYAVVVNALNALNDPDVLTLIQRVG